MKQEFTITIYTSNYANLLHNLAAIFSSKLMLPVSLNSYRSDDEGIHHFTMVLFETEHSIMSILGKIEKLPGVYKVNYYSAGEILWQELALYKVPANEVTEKVQVERLLRQFGARTIVIRKDYIVFETTGQRSETEKLRKVLEPFGLIECVRGGRVAICKKTNNDLQTLTESQSHLVNP